MSTENDDEIKSKKDSKQGSNDRDGSSNEMGIEGDLSLSQSDSNDGNISNSAAGEEEIIVPPH